MFDCIFKNQEFKSVLKVDYDESKSCMKIIKCIKKKFKPIWFRECLKQWMNWPLYVLKKKRWFYMKYTGKKQKWWTTMSPYCTCTLYYIIMKVLNSEWIDLCMVFFFKTWFYMKYIGKQRCQLTVHVHWIMYYIIMK
jgi:hypothetical protein